MFWIRCRNFIKLYTSFLFLCHFMLPVLGKEWTQVVWMKACYVTHPTYIVLLPTVNIAKWECSDRGPIDGMQGRIWGYFVLVEEILWRDVSCCSWFLWSEFVYLTQCMYCYRLLVSISCRQVMESANIISSDFRFKSWVLLNSSHSSQHYDLYWAFQCLRDVRDLHSRRCVVWISA